MKLKVRSSDTAMVSDYNALASGIRRFVGRKFDPTLGPQGGWPLLNEPVEVTYRAEYAIHVRQGDLIPADKVTADFCGVPFPG